MSTLPPGVVPNYVNPPDHKSQDIALHSIMVILVTIATTMRVWTRAAVTKSFGLDDFITVFAWAATVSWSGTLLASENFGIGRHLWDIPPEWMITGLKFLFVTELMYIIIAMAVKLSFLFCFDRIFGTSRVTRYFIWFGIFANTVFYIVVFFDTLFLCKPIALAWNPMLKGKCGSQKILPYATGIFGFLSDFYIFILPMPCVWKLQMKTTRKFKLMAAFSVGLFACVASIIRFVFTVRLVNNVDATWNYITLSVWAVLEVDIGLICSCLLSFPAFYERYKPAKFDSLVKRLTSYITTSSGTRSSSNATSRAPVKEANRYAELNDSGAVPLHLRGDVNATKGEYYRAKVERSNSVDDDEDYEELTALPQRVYREEGVNVKRTVDVDLEHGPGGGQWR